MILESSLWCNWRDFRRTQKLHNAGIVKRLVFLAANWYFGMLRHCHAKHLNFCVIFIFINVAIFFLIYSSY